MGTVVAFVVMAVVGTMAVLAYSRPWTVSHDPTPWVLSELAGKHVVIMGGLAGFAVTGIVLIVGVAREQASPSAVPLSTVVIMMVVAYFFYVGNAFLFSYFLPNREGSKNVPPRVHLALGSTIEYRTLFVSWLALMPLLDAYGMQLPRQVLGWLVPASMAFGSVIITMVISSIGLMRIRDVAVTMVLATALALAYGMLVISILPGLKWAFSSIAIAIIIFGLNGVGFMLAALTPLSPRHPVIEGFFERYGGRIVTADLVSTVVSVSLLGLAVAGAI